MTAICFRDVTKIYDLHSGSRSMLASLRALSGFGVSDSEFHALSGLSFEIRKGEAFGIIGRNGAGKSTILKLIAGITSPTRGVVEVNGLVSSLIELGAGFHPDLSGRENVYMSGAILGIPKKVIDDKFRQILDFSELHDFIDVPVKKYSSGMYARLGFAVAISVEPDILIVDEILSVGDIFFQQKCFTTMREIIAKGTTFLFVTHDTAAMQALCKRALLLDSGRVEFIGDTAEAVSRYYAKMGQASSGKRTTEKTRPVLDQANAVSPSAVEEILRHSILNVSAHRHGEQGIELLAARVTGESDADTLNVPMQEALTFTLLFRANKQIHDPSCGIHLYDRTGTLVFAAGTRQLRYPLPDLKPGEQLVVRFRLTFNVGPGEYTFSLGASEPAGHDLPNAGLVHDRHEMLGPVTVTADDSEVYPFYGVAQLPMSVEYCSVKEN